MADMQKSGTVYQTSEEALVAYEAHLKTVGKTVDWAAAKNKLLSASLKVLSTVGWMVVATIATEVISCLYQVTQVSSELQDKAEELGNTFKSTKQDIADYKDQIADLYKTINDSDSSIEEVTNARKDLMSIQDQLIEKYGSEKEVIDIITDAVDGQTEAFERLTAAQYQATKNEFNDNSGWENIPKKIFNWINGYESNYDSMIDTMENYAIFDFLETYAEAVGSLNKEDQQSFFNRLKNVFGDDVIEDVGFSYLNMSGELDEVHDKLIKLQELASDFDFNKNFSNYLTEKANDAKKVLDKYSEMYETYIVQEKILGSSGIQSGYDKIFADINEAYKKYQDSMISGDEKREKEAINEYARIVNEAIDSVKPEDVGVADFFKNMYPILQNEVATWKFKVDFSADSSELKHDLEFITDFYLEDWSKEDLLGFNKETSNFTENTGYNKLNQIADRYELSYSELIDLLEEFDLVESQAYKDLVDYFGQDAVDKLTPEDLEIAYTISSEEADKALDQEKNKIKSELESLSKEGNVNLTIRPVIDSSAMQAAGWNVENGSIATTFAQGEFIWQGDEENGQYVYVHYTPILPDGTVLTPDELTDYLYGTLEGSQNVLDADTKGLVLKVDTDLNIPEDDIKKFQNGEGSTDTIDGLIEQTGEWDNKVHDIQEQYYETGDSIAYASNALDGLIEKHKELQNPDEINISDVFSMENAKGEATTLSDLNDQLSDVTNAYETCLGARDEFNKQGYLSVDTLQSVLALGDEYLQYLFDEEGNVNLDAEAFQKLTLARINDMETQALADLAQNIQQITDETKATEYLAQKQNDLASSYTDVAASALLAMTQIEGFSDSKALQDAYSSFVTQYEQIKSLFAKTKSGITTEYNGMPKTDTDYKSILDKEITAQEKAYEAGKTTFKEYLDNRKQLVEKYYRDKKITTAEYYEELEDLAQAEADFYDEVLAAVTRRIQREIDGIQDIIDGLEKQNEILEKQKDIYDSALSAIRDYLDAEKEKYQNQIDNIGLENDKIQEQIDKYDLLLDTVSLVFDEKREALQAEQKAIDDRIEALQKEKDEYQKTIQLEKAKEELIRSQQQRTKMLYAGEARGFIYQTDTNAIADAEQTLSDLTFDSTIDALEKEKELLQDIVDQLDKTEESWQKIATNFDDNKAKSTAQELFGNDYENIILNGDPEMIASIMNQYTSAQQKLEDNTTLISSIEEKIANLDRLSDKWGEVADAHEKAIDRENAAMLLGKEWQALILADRQIDYENFKNNYLAIQAQIDDNTATIESYNERIEHYENLKSQWESITDDIIAKEDERILKEQWGADYEEKILGGRIDVLNDFKDEFETVQNRLAEIAEESARRQVEAAKSVENLDIPDETPTTSQSGGGAASLDKRLKLQTYAKGGIVNDKSSGDLDWIAEQLDEDHIVAVRDYERILNPQENITYEKMLKAFPEIQANYNPAMTMKVPEYMNVQPVERVTQPIIQNINITLPNVTNNSGYENFVRALNQLSNDALQFSKRR